MKISPISIEFRKSRGYATLAGVAAIALALISMLTFSLLSNMNSFDTQVRAQMKQDYSQKEDAILTALLHIVPNKAIGAMKSGSATNAENYTWESIFEEALTVANAEQAADSSMLASLGLSNAISANTGDTQFESVSELVESPGAPYDGSRKLVNGGNWYEYRMLFQPNMYPFIPAPLMCSYSDYQLDQSYPIVSLNKKYLYNYQSYNSIYHKGLLVNSDSYPLYNQLIYPDVKFGYRRPGEKFVAKRNWWTFTLTFGKGDQARTGMPPVRKTYVLSLYEVPSQVPLSASALMQVGQFADGTDWENVSLDGGIYADAIETQGSVSLSKGSISARKSMSLSTTTSVDGNTVANDFDEMGKRENRALASDTDFYDASVGGNVGKVAFLPLNPGYNFLKRSPDGAASQRISPTGWKDYTRGANQAKMRLDILEMTALDTQIPIKVRLYYQTTSNTVAQIDYTRGDNWPSDLEVGGDIFPFQTDVLESQRNALVLHMDRLPAFLASSVPSAAGINVNNSIYVSPLSSEPTVEAPSNPSLDSDTCITLRGGRDLSPYGKGFSIVTDLRLYIGETLNSVATTPPANSGLPLGAEYYPPVSLFAPEKRFGESVNIQNPINLRGQLSTLKTSTSDTFNPMELKTANDTRIESDLLDAELVSIESPAELPPIYLMNWMLTVEEVHR
ncbi:MAG: hypothetical protein P1U87_16670 [Verrucomicrobiales bacterium]|nr:hypothetical protein [Verrucomicrobiales bacterium]